MRNPGEYDFKKYYHNKKIAAKIYSNEQIQVYSNSDWSLKKSINSFREVVRSKLTAYSDDDTSALLSALILGDRTQVDQDLWESFANVGVIHVLAVSGLHVGYVLVILLLIVKTIRIRWGWDKLFIDKLTDNDFIMLINDGEVIKSDVLKISYPKQIPKNINEFIQTANPKMTIITRGKSGKYSPTINEIDELFNSELFFTDSIGAVWFSSDGVNPIEVKNWR